MWLDPFTQRAWLKFEQKGVQWVQWRKTSKIAAVELGARLIAHLIPGLGALRLESITNRDYALVQNATLFFALMVTAVSLLTDLAYPLLDPRVRYE